VDAWFRQGCERCRQGILSGADWPAELAVNVELHAALHRCAACGAYWEINEREAHVISEEEARTSFPTTFRNWPKN
jgi:hypothetical protein